MIIVNQDKMAEAGMSRVQIKMALEKAIDKLIGNDYIEFTILDFNFEIDFKYIPSESKLNEETGEFEETKESSLVIEKVTEYNPKKLLESYGIKVEKSGISDSLYFEIDGKEYRLSDHKRPAVEDASGVFQEHEDDDFNIIKEDSKAMFKWAEDFAKEKGLKKISEKKQIAKEIKATEAPQQNVSRDIIRSLQMLESYSKDDILEHARYNLPLEDLLKKIDKNTYTTFYYLKEKFSEEAFKQFVGYMQQQMRAFAKEWYYIYTKTDDILTRNLSTALGVDLVNLKPDIFNTKLREVLEVSRQVALPLIQSYQSKVKSMIQTFAFNPPKASIRKDGKVYTTSLRNRAESTVRYMANLEDIESLKRNNVKLVWISSHPNCSKRCEKYQGRLYSLDGSSGTIDGHRYTPLAEALKGPLGDGNGILNGYNCRHRAIEYTPKSRAPNDYNEREIALERSIDSRQRYYESKIRNLKTEERLLKTNGFTEDAKKIKARWQRLVKNYESFSQKNGRAFYRWRYEI